MTITKKEEAELLKVYNTWWESYLTGDIITYNSFLDDDFRFVGSTGGEEFLNRKDSTAFFKATADQFAGKSKLENINRTIECIEGMVLITDLTDAYILDGTEWAYYARFRFTSFLRNTSNGWRFFYQHFSTPDLKAEEGESIGMDKITSENLELRNAIKRRTVELELKNRDLEIEAALGRIRAKVTAMSQSSDLLDIVVTMRTEFVKLGHQAQYFWHMRWLPNMYQKAMTSGDGTRIGMIMELPRDFHSHYKGMSEWENNQEPYIVLALETEIAVDYVDKMIRQGNFQQVDPNAPSLDDVRHIGGLTFISARTTHGEIGYSLPGVVKSPPKKDLDILVRFAAAFDLAHKRFEDLRRSEEQMRETQIELGLERVRARAMAMQDSSELSDLVDTVFKELSKLDFALQACIINILDADNLSNTVWMKSPDIGNTPDSYLLKFEDYPFHHAMMDAYLKRETKFIYVIEEAEKREYDKYLFSETEFRKISSKAKDSFIALEKYVCSFTFSNFGGLQTIGDKPLSASNLEILERFGKVFDLTYTRFNDLKLAEAQARESLIELALEKVRARTMAMHQSIELAETAAVLFQQFNELGVTPERLNIGLVKEEERLIEFWSTEQGGKQINKLFKGSIDEPTTISKVYGAWKSGKKSMVIDLSGQELKDWLRYMTEEMGLPFKKELIHGRRYHSTSFFTHGIILMSTPEPLSEDTMSLLPRFAKVFEQTYTRFLDLQKSEAQAREAQINLAVERVRAKALAMHKSEEIMEVVAKLKDEVMDLDIPDVVAATIFLKEGEDKVRMWDLSSLEKSEEGYEVPLDITFKLKKTDPHLYVKRVWENPDNYFVEIQDEKGFKRIMAWLREHHKNKVADEVKEFIETTKLKRLYHVAKKLNNGKLCIDLLNPPLDEMEYILTKMGAAFDLAYKRFEDLQKAEAQAREAQIEAALERVRSRSMAMHNSEELKEVIQVVYEQFVSLNIHIEHTGFIMDYKARDDMHIWLADRHEIQSEITFPYFDCAYWNSFNDAKEKGLDFFVTHLTFEEKNKFYQDLFELISDVPEEAMESYLSYPGLAGSTVLLENVGLYIENFSAIPYSDEENAILMRFGKVFQQTYTRFLDLQRAEAQAKEAQIETALERVRSRSMAMHKSEELLDVISVVSEQLQQLNFQFIHVSFANNDISQDYKFWTASRGMLKPMRFITPYLDIAMLNNLRDAQEKSVSFYTDILTKEEHIQWHKHLLNHGGSKVFSKEENEFIMSRGMARSIALNPNILLILANYTPIAYSEDENKIIERFGQVFEQSYTRFLDLQKAEGQAREAQIEAALERVRSRTMAMHSSNDVEDTVVTLFEEVLNLGLDPSIRCGIGILEGFEGMETRSTNRGPDGKVALRVGILDMSIHPMLVGLKKAWKSGKKGYSYEYSKEDVKIYYKALNEEPEYPFNADLKALPEREFHNSFFFSSGILFAFTENPLSEESFNILNRFAQVFDQTYRRFLDLQKAEAQAREAQIEAALERVRARTMAMQRSEELLEVATVLFKQVKELGVPQWNCGFNIWNIGDKEFTYYPGSPDGVILSSPCKISLTEHPVFRRFDESRKRGDELFVYEKEGEEQADHYQYMLSHPGVGELLQNMLDSGYELPKFQIDHIANFSYGNLIFITYEHFPEMHDVFKRFAKVFEQTYTRFLDLQKAEAQAKEAQIEASLEKVRSRTMAMQSSTELVEAANLLFNQVRDLGINAWSTGYNVLSEDKTKSKCWMSSEDQLQDPFPLFFTKEASFIEMGNFLKSDADFFVQELGGKALKQHYDYMISIPELEDTFKHIQDVGLTLPDYQINHLCKFKQGFLLFITYEKSPEAHDIFKRFTKVFEQTYTRFLDLQKAENQSKEAHIELALERVRAGTMAMHKSEQLAQTAQVLFEQFDLLGVIPDRMSIAIFNEKKRIFELWATDQSGTNVSHGHDFSIDEPTCMAKTYKAWKEKKETFIVDLKGKELKDWIRFVKEDAKMELDESKFKGRRLQNCAFFSQGYLLLSSHLPITDEMMQLLLRFAKVFQQTYTRFLDLQRAETQAREAIKRASVDRVRAEIASMRTSTDLERITPLVWNELTTLDVPFIRCGVFIMDEEKQQVQTHLSTPDGKAIASFNLPFENTEPLTQLLPHWRKKEIYKDHWDESAFIESTKILMERGAITSSETYVTEHQPTNLHLHFLPFLQGMLYVGSEVSLSEDELHLVQNLADAFSTAYSRYEDFNKLELANKKIEKTLVDLKQTQTQLVQSEKMASLGELTAGIAHEIQNPLNFVNNFSEVSAELVEEMNEEINQGNLDFAKEIAIDLKQNLEKINHHGKRAGEIVKGMLQHSRTNSGQKELTDINALADEYLRLAYHGLRAKDKSFNAKMESHFDPDLPKLEVIPQDIGRVILNMITNAFYVVNERKKQDAAGYEPLVSVSTRKTGAKIEIKVKDNGKGMPKQVKEKIFQPFFTTKPTGQGTGLGLSLSYDIIKAHGGEIKVETKEEVGTTFIIQLTTL